MTTQRQIQHYARASQTLKMDGHDNGHITIRARGFTDRHLPIEITLDPGEFAKELDGIVPGFRVSYNPAATYTEHEAERAVERQRATELEAALLLVKSNGYEVTKQRDFGAEYVDGLFRFASGIETTEYVTKLESQGAHHLAAVIARAAEVAGRGNLEVEIYVEVDRALLIDVINEAGGIAGRVAGGALWTHLWPVVARINDEGDVILHVTDGDRAQFGAEGRRP